MQEEPLILTLKLDQQIQDFFDAQRALYFPPERNFLKAHATLFHQLPDEPDTFKILQNLNTKAFELEVTNLLFLGAGVAYSIKSKPLNELHTKLKLAFEDYLIPQDKQPFRPHITIQNKVKPETAKELRAKLSADFVPFVVRAKGLELWRYLGGSWEAVKTFNFTSV